MRAKADFHMSTMVRACYSLRNGIGDVLRTSKTEAQAALILLDATDEAVQRGMVILADIYADELHQALLERQSKLEAQLRAISDERLATLEAQKLAIDSLSSPIIEVWDGVLVAPLIGSFDAERMSETRERIVTHVVATRSSTLLVDITGLSLLSPELAEELARLVSCVRLVGGEAMLVGVSPNIAIAFAQSSDPIRGLAAFATLRSGLREAFRRRRLRVVQEPDGEGD